MFKKGFTLVELLVVTTVITILVTTAFSVFRVAQSRARDSERQQEVHAIAKALEANKVLGSFVYPQISTAWFAEGRIPVTPNGTPQYSLIWPTVANQTVAGAPTAWPTNSRTPTGLAANTQVVEIVAGVPSPTTNFSAFRVCILLENGTANIYCVSSQQ